MYEAELKIVNDTPPLDLNFDLLCDAKTYKVSQSLIAGASDHITILQRIALNRVLLFDSRRQTYDQTRRCADSLMLLGQVSVTSVPMVEGSTSLKCWFVCRLIVLFRCY